VNSRIRLILRFLLLSVAAIVPLEAEETQDQAIAVLKAADAEVMLDSKGNAISVTIPFSVTVVPRVTNDDLAHLRALPFLKQLKLHQCANITNDGMRHLSGLNSLESLELSMTNVTEAGLDHCKGLTALETLFIGNLKGAEVTGRALTYFRDSKALKAVTIEPAFGVTDEDLQHLCLFPKLRTVNLAPGAFGDKGLVYIGELPELAELNIAFSTVSGPGLVHLRNLPHLTKLDLSGCKMWDIGLMQVEYLRNLKSLDLSSAFANFDILDRIESKNPSLKIIRPAGVADEQAPLYSLRQMGSVHATFGNDKRLSALTIIGTAGIRDSSLRFDLGVLKKFPSLKKLSIRESNPPIISDHSVPNLVSLKGLMTLELIGTTLTPAGIQALKDGLPACHVTVMGFQ